MGESPPGDGMPTRGLTLSGRGRRPGPAAILLILAPVSGTLAPRQVAKESLTRVPLRDLALEAQYAEVREALSRYREPDEGAPQEGEVKCRRCGTVSPEDRARCECGTFLHFHRIFTCPGCTTVVPREARDCARCGAAFWSPVNPPEHGVTDAMVSEYLEGLQQSDLA